MNQQKVMFFFYACSTPEKYLHIAPPRRRNNPAILKGMQEASHRLAESRFTLKAMTENTMETYNQLLK